MSEYGLVYNEIIETTTKKVNAETFLEYLECLIGIGIPQYVTLYMDNASIHHTTS